MNWKTFWKVTNSIVPTITLLLIAIAGFTGNTSIVTLQCNNNYGIDCPNPLVDKLQYPVCPVQNTSICDMEILPINFFYEEAPSNIYYYAKYSVLVSLVTLIGGIIYATRNKSFKQKSD